MDVMTNVHEIKLTREDEFSQKFNRVSDLYKKAMESDLEEDWNEFFKEKYNLELGI